MAATVKVTYDRKSAMEYIRKLKTSYAESMIEFRESAATKGVEIVKGHIIRQDLDWDRLAPITEKRKGHGRKWIDSGLLLNNIAYNANNSIIRIGVKEGVHYPNGAKLSSVMEWVEEGKKKGSVPPRPLFVPSSEELNHRHLCRHLSF